MSSSDGKLREFLKKVLVHQRCVMLAFFLELLLLLFIGVASYSAFAESNNDKEVASTFVTTTQTTTQETKPKETESTTKKVLSTTTTRKTTTTTLTTTTTKTTTTTTVTTTDEENVVVEPDGKIVNCSYYAEDQVVYEKVYDESTEVEEVIEISDADYNADRTRPYISSGEYTLASMMANEAGSSDITAIRTGIGFMNRIHNSQFQNGSIEGVYNAGGYCYSTPNAHHQELAAEVISAYNGSDEYWSQYCVEHQVTDKTVFHHNGSYPQSWEYPVYVEYGDTGWYQWTMLYSEHAQDHY